MPPFLPFFPVIALPGESRNGGSEARNVAPRSIVRQARLIFGKSRFAGQGFDIDSEPAT
jgi:hypothetical protein